MTKTTSRPCCILLAAAFSMCIQAACIGAVAALEPEEILIVVNQASKSSTSIADYYAQKRSIPRENMVYLRCPDTEDISRQDYLRAIAWPVKRWLSVPEHGARIRCLVLTMGIPLKIKAQGMNAEEMISFLKLRHRMRAIDQALERLKIDEKTRSRYKKEKARLRQSISIVDHQAEVASVDSELTLVKRSGDYELAGWILNPLYLPARTRVKEDIRPSDVLLVSRLDGPDTKTVFRMIDDSLFAEKNGLRGTAYFDCRYPSLSTGSHSIYQAYDKQLRFAAQVTEQAGIKTIVNTEQALFPPGSCPDAILYCGWYSLARYVDAFTWKRGAIAYHMASRECENLHGTGQQWCPMLLKDGVSVSLGPVTEPYLQAFPSPYLFFKLLLEPRLAIAEVYMLSCPYLSWQMVLLADPLYRPFKSCVEQAGR